ncbi:MAG: AMIN domain-containing protein [Myxococcales bacterium]|nr:AMIN domain-containing protein [Myxococcales bacterium]
MRFAVIAALLALALPAMAADGDEAKAPVMLRTGPYLGVQPGAKDVAPGKATVRSRGAIRVVTWVGFQMAGQGGRVFIQGTEPPEYDIVAGEPDEVVIELRSSRLHSTNDGRKLDTGWFPTAVLWVQARQLKGNVVRVTIKMRETVGYDLRQEGNYLFLDFRPPTGPIVAPKLPTPTPDQG